MTAKVESTFDDDARETALLSWDLHNDSLSEGGKLSPLVSDVAASVRLTTTVNLISALSGR